MRHYSQSADDTRVAIGAIIVLPVWALPFARHFCCHFRGLFRPLLDRPTGQGACVEEAKHFIGGEWAASSNGETIPVIDPSDGQPFATLARGTAADIDTAVQSARRAYEGA